MSDRAMDFILGVAAIFIGSGVLIAGFAFAGWLVGYWQLQKCAAQNNVYACVFVATPVRKE